MTHQPDASWNADTPLTLTTLGGFELARPGAGQPVFSSSKPLALITYLAFAPGRTARRDQLVDLLWADLPPDDAAHAFRQTLWFIRQRCGPHLMRTINGSVRLEGQLHADRDAFLAAIARQDSQAACELYTGDFLPGYAAPGGADFEHWADIERQRLRQLFVRAAEVVVRQCSGHAKHREAIALARRVVAAHPGHQAAQRLLLETLIAAGDCLAAATEADLIERQLLSDDIQPDAPMAVLLAAARQTPAATPRPHGATGLVSELVGREAEFRAIIAGWEDVRAGRGRHIHIVGAAGLGKSRLLQDAGNRLRASAARCVTVRANIGESLVPGSLIADLAQAVAGLQGAMSIQPATAGILLDLNPALATRYPAATPPRVQEPDAARLRMLALSELIACVAEEGPFGIVVDDVHWADSHSQQVLAGLLNRLAHVPVLLLSAARPSAEGLLERPDSNLLVLTPLRQPDIAALIASVGTLPDQPWADAMPADVHTASRGIPLLVLETLQLALDRGAVTLHDAQWNCADPGLLHRELTEGGALRRRLAALDRHPHWLLLALAADGAPCPQAVLTHVANRTAEAVLSDLQSLERAGLVVRQGSNWLPAHDAIAEVALEAAAPEAARAAHLALGRALAQDPRDTPTLIRACRHFAAGGDDRQLAALLGELLKRDGGAVRRTAREWVTYFTGLDPDNERTVAILRNLPLGLVHPQLRTLRRIAAMIILGAGAASVAWSMIPESQAPIRLLAYRPVRDSFQLAELHIDPARLVPGETLSVEHARRLRDLPRVGNHSRAVFLRPRGQEWATWDVYRDAATSSNQDLAFISPGRDQRFLPHAGDDYPEGWAPDGSFLLAYTDRFDNASQGDIVAIDMADSSIHRIAAGPARDIAGVWSPDGSRIAWVRRVTDAAEPERFCWGTIDGRRGSCLVPAPFEARMISGWLNETEVIATVTDSAGRPSVARIDVDAGTVIPVFRGTTAGKSVGPWILCECESRRGESAQLSLRHVEDPYLRFPVRRDSLVATIQLAPTTRAPARYVDRLDLPGMPGDSLATGIPFRLRPRGLSPSGHEVDFASASIEWRSSDTTVVGVDSAGTLLPKRPGTSTIHVSLGGWRAAFRTVRVVAAMAPDTVLAEAWNGTWPERWMPFGHPRPTTVTQNGVAHFFHNGDSSWASGAHSRMSWSAERGLAVRLTLQAPITLEHWQSIGVVFHGISDMARMRAWDHVTGSLPTPDEANTCGFGIPAGEGAGVMDGVNLGGAGHSITRQYPGLRRRPFEVVLQILPDGRCAAAIDGTAVMITERRLNPDKLFHLWIQGYSHNTTMLAGPLSVIRGVAPEFDWRRASSAARAAARPRPVRRQPGAPRSRSG